MRKLMLALIVLSSSFANCYAYGPSVDCFAVGVGALNLGIHKLEIKKVDIDDQFNVLALLIDNIPASLIKSSEECGEDLECNIAKGYPISFIHPISNIGLVLNLNAGESKLENEEEMRGGKWIETVKEISPEIRGGGRSMQLSGVCYQD